jgi:hypothetical protein
MPEDGADSSKTLIPIYQTIWCHIPEVIVNIYKFLELELSNGY